MTRGTCWSSRAGCSCRTRGRTAGGGTRPRCWCARRCRRGPRRGGEGAELLGDDGEGALPGHGLVPVRTLGQIHGLRDASLLAEPVAAAGGEVGERVRGEEVRGDAAQGGFLGDGLGAVLAEFGGVPLVAFGPGAAGAVEAVLLVDLEEGLRGAADAHLLLGDAQAVGDGGQPGGGVLGRLDPGCVLDRVSCGRLGGHRAPLRACRGPCAVRCACFLLLDPGTRCGRAAR